MSKYSYPMDYDIEPWNNFNSHNMVVAVIGFIMVVVVIVYIWKCCKCDEQKPASTETPTHHHQIPLVPCYVHEIEPGLVVVQSTDGEYFRILQEYNGPKIPKSTLSPGGSSQSSQPLQYIPQFTRPHFQTHAQPSAPISEQTRLIEFTSEQPPPYYSTPLQH